MIIKGEEIHSVHICEEEDGGQLFTTILIRFCDGRQKYFEFEEDIETANRIENDED